MSYFKWSLCFVMMTVPVWNLCACPFVAICAQLFACSFGYSVYRSHGFGKNLQVRM